MEKSKFDWYQAFVTDEHLQLFHEPLRPAAQVMLREEIEGIDGKSDFEESQRCVVAGLLRFHDFTEGLSTIETETVAKLICSAYLLGREAIIVEIQENPIGVLARALRD